MYNRLSNSQSFKTRTGLAGRSGTRPTRAWDRFELRQKPARELARGNPVGRPRTRSTRPNPGETRSIFFIFTVIKRVLHFYLICYPQNLKPFFFPWSCKKIPGKANQLSSQDNTFFLQSLLLLSTNKWSFRVV